MRTNRANGMYFTFDQNDLNHNVDAWIVGASWPNPYGDFDDDNGDARSDEAEVVSESTSFPAANTWYTVEAYWSHSYYSGGWQYDPDDGWIQFIENLSVVGWFGDKYNTHCCNANLNMNQYYPYDAAGFAESELQSDPAAALSASSLDSVTVPEGRAYTASADGGEPTDIQLHADLAGGLLAYTTTAWALARVTAAAGGSEGVVTFTRPLTWNELEIVRATGLVIDRLEVVSEPDAQGLRWSFFIADTERAQEFIALAAENAGVAALGVVSATATVPGAGVLEALSTSELVYLVDLSIADFKLHNPELSDVIQNDVYWHLAGWD